MSNKALKKKIVEHLTSYGWKNIQTSNAPIDVWNKNDGQVVLPKDELVEHDQSEGLLIAALEKIEIFDQVNLLSTSDSDKLSVHASGAKVGFGKIIYKEGLDALSGLFDIIKNNAYANINIKGKTKYVSEYMQNVHMNAPQSGSMIYKAELGLYEPQDDSGNNSFKELGSLGRVLNEKCARLIFKASKIFDSPGDHSPAILIKEGIDINFCEAFVNLFSDSVDNLDFRFDWSSKEQLTENIPSEIHFTSSHREKAQKYVKAFKKTQTLDLVELPAVIEKYSWPRDASKGKVSFKASLDEVDFTMTFETSESLYLRLKEEKVKKEVSLTGKFLKTENKKSKLEILYLKQIRVGPSEFIEIGENEEHIAE
ncbi:hypothetical protein [Alteromonas sp. PRIM-21]|uniref:hypothetical protein n=1 Tax=Alteromonas sp. PRIM-21 TaxID=1454978 RepID=UPI0022B9C01A|nr:hypothetical protein [Alteromonas sp. PRIM-21]MCZ8529905.1 hypothetical protein [Alteromonas sp. PRIM-21]